MSGMGIQDNSTLGHDDLVQILNDKMADLMVPAVVYIVILMVTGTIGNVMVCFYYGFKIKLTPNSLFIVVLAIYDLSVCLVTMPTDIADIELYYTFTNDAACRILRFVTNWSILGSVLTLVAIAVDRYRRIKKPTSNQMSVRTAKVTSTVFLVLAAAMTWPSAVIFGSTAVGIPNDLGRNLTGFDCTTSKDRTYRKYLWAYYSTQIAIVVIITTLLIVLYAIIVIAVCKQRRKMALHMHAYRKDASTNIPMHEASNNTPSTDTLTESNQSHGKEGGDHTILDHETIKITMVMVAITIIFILSGLPYVTLIVWRTGIGEHETEFLSDAGLIGFNIGSRSYLLNSALNPWVYGIFNSEFRNYFFRFRCLKYK